MTSRLVDLKAYALSSGGSVTQFSSPGNLPVAVFDILSQKYILEWYRTADLYSARINGVWPAFDRYLVDGSDFIQGGLTYNDYSLQLRGVDSGGIGIGQEYFQGMRPIAQLIAASPRPAQEYETGVWIHGGSGPAFFGHWLWEFLTKFVVLKMAGRLNSSHCILTTALPKRFLQWLDFLFDEPPRLSFVDPIGNPGVWDVVEVISTPIYRSRHDNRIAVARDVLQELRLLGRERACAVNLIDTPSGSRLRALWVERNSAWRNLLNTEEMIVELGKYYDIDRISFEGLSPAEQIRAIQSYDLLIGPSGSSMPISVFASPKTVVLEFFNPRNEGRLAAKLFCDVFGIPHVRVNGKIVGEQNGPTHTDFNYAVDPSEFAEVIRKVCIFQDGLRTLRARHDFS
jgi:hypothetical protein